MSAYSCLTTLSLDEHNTCSIFLSDVLTPDSSMFLRTDQALFVFARCRLDSVADRVNQHLVLLEVILRKPDQKIARNSLRNAITSGKLRS